MKSRKNILITGAAAGFGALIARTLLAQGHTVFATMRDPKSRNASKAQALAAYSQGKPGKLHVLELDVTSEASADAALLRAVELEGGLDVLINNAGGGHGLGAYAEAVSMEQFEHAFNVNVFGVQCVTRAALPSLRKSGKALIVNISSIMGRIVLPYSATYTATKYAVEGLSESYRYELSGLGVDVVLIEPGGFPTEFFSSIDAPAHAERLESYGPLADAPARMYAGFAEMLGKPDAPNPQLVADAVLRIIETPGGQRPLRVVVDPLLGGQAPEALNKTTHSLQKDVLGALGQQDLLVLKGLD
ncbi:MAG: SDR family oxidoreductase [Fibrobacteria bacterium]